MSAKLRRSSGGILLLLVMLCCILWFIFVPRQAVPVPSAQSTGSSAPAKLKKLVVLAHVSGYDSLARSSSWLPLHPVFIWLAVFFATVDVLKIKASNA